MEFAIVNKDKIVDMYLNEKKSATEIAEALSVNITKIRRSLAFLGVEIRSYSEAQKAALASGKAKHPTAGTTRSKATITKMSEGISKTWKDTPQSKKDEINALRKERWDAMSVEQRRQFQDLAHKAIRESAEIGSKTERYCSASLEDLGYDVIIHARNLVQSASLEVDMFIPSLKTAIEIDGHSHFFPIWGASKFAKQQLADSTKQGLLLNAGYVILRVKQMDKSFSKKRMDDVLKAIVAELKLIENEFPAEGRRFIEIEVSNGEIKRI